jgi:hypothetical protein
VFEADAIEIIKTPLPRAPRANAICERLAGILRRGLLDRDITCFVGGQGRCGGG